MCFADTPKLNSQSLRYKAEKEVGYKNPGFGGDELSLKSRSSHEQETDSVEEKDPVYSIIPEVFTHTYENSGDAGYCNSHYQALNAANGRSNAVYAGLYNSDPPYENPVTQSKVRIAKKYNCQVQFVRVLLDRNEQFVEILVFFTHNKVALGAGLHVSGSLVGRRQELWDKGKKFYCSVAEQ